MGWIGVVVHTSFSTAFVQQIMQAKRDMLRLRSAVEIHARLRHHNRVRHAVFEQTFAWGRGCQSMPSRLLGRRRREGGYRSVSAALLTNLLSELD
jgi:hypothetical protein